MTTPGSFSPTDCPNLVLSMESSNVVFSLCQSFLAEPMSKCLVFLMLGCISLSLNQQFALLGPSFYVCCISMQVVPQAFHLTKKVVSSA